MALSSHFILFISYNKNSAPLNLTKEEFASLKSLSKNDSLIIQKSDKGNSIAIINKDDYLQKMRNILSDSSKFSSKIFFFTIKNSFEFAKEVVEQDSGLFMASLDVESLFINIPLEETINIS